MKATLQWEASVDVLAQRLHTIFLHSTHEQDEVSYYHALASNTNTETTHKLFFKGFKGFESGRVSLLIKHLKEEKAGIYQQPFFFKISIYILGIPSFFLSYNNSKMCDFLSGRNYKGRPCGPHTKKMEPQM